MKNRNISFGVNRSHFAPAKKSMIPPNRPSISSIKIGAGSVLKSQSNNSSPSLKSFKDQPFKKINSCAKLPYTNWEIFNACQGPRDKVISQRFKNLRINFKNPYIFDNGTDVNSNQKNIENRLFRVYRKILRD